MIRQASVLALALATLVGCGREERALAPERAPPEPPAPEGEAASAAFNRVTAIAARDGEVLVGTDAGVILLDERSGAWRLLGDATDGAVLHDAVTGVAFAADGTAWSSHASGASAPPQPASAAKARRGGVRHWPRGAGDAPAVWLAEDGLGGDDVAAIAVSEDVVAAAVDRAVAVLAAGDPERLFRRRLAEEAERVTVVALGDPDEPPRTVTELRSPRERVLSVAASGAVIDVGTTHALYRLGPSGAWRFDLPCHARRRAHALVPAVAHGEAGLLVAALGSGDADGAWEPAGVLELRPDFTYRCHAPGMDVPDAPTLGVCASQGVVHLATHEGLTRVEGTSVELFDLAGGAPPWPATAVASDGAGGCWAGTWGGGVFHVTGRAFAHHRFDASSRRSPAVAGVLR